MTDDTDNSANQSGADDLLTTLNSETAVVSWGELVRHFARGVVIHVSPQLDLIETAACLAKDDTNTLQQWLDKGLVRRASDDDARDWNDREPDFWCVVAAPWVLAQEKTMGCASVKEVAQVVH